MMFDDRFLTLKRVLTRVSLLVFKKAPHFCIQRLALGGFLLDGRQQLVLVE